MSSAAPATKPDVADVGVRPGEFVSIPLEKLRESSTNPRKHFDKVQLQELADSIRAKGVLMPLLVRPLGGKLLAAAGLHEIVAGERRFKAAKLAGLDAVPCRVGHISDAAALEIQVIENLQRTDLHPLEEAEGYEQLMKLHRLTVDDLAAKVGKSKGYVYARMKLTALKDEASRKAFLAGEINASVALLIARIPNERLQKEFGARVLRGPLAYRQALELYHEQFMLRLSGAPFRTDDAELLPGAGPCTTCPKRTGNQAQLFEDIKGADVCTDPPCFEKKRAAWARLRLEAVRAKGLEVREGKAAKEIFPYEHSGARNGFADVEEACFQDPKHRTLRQLLKVAGDAAPKPIVVADPHRPGQIREVLREKEVPALLKAAGVKVQRNTTASTYVKSAAEKAHEAKHKLEEQIRRAIVTGIHESRAKLAREDLELIAAGFFADVWFERRKLVAGLWGWEGVGSGHASSASFAAKRLKDLSDVALGRFMADVALSATIGYDLSLAQFLGAAKRAGVDVAKIRRDLTKAAAEKKAAKANRGNKKAKRRAA